MFYQLHQQNIRTQETKLCEQFCSSGEFLDIKGKIEGAMDRNPLEDGMSFMLCNENSEFFINGVINGGTALVGKRDVTSNRLAEGGLPCPDAIPDTAK